MVFPENVRVHMIVDYWYCCEKSRLMACLGLESPYNEEMDCGSQVHEWLSKRPRTMKEKKLSEALWFYVPFTRTFENVKIIGHPDDLTVHGKNKVQIIEYKTVDQANVKPWKSVLAKYQVQVYAWILEPILKELGYQLSHVHKVVYLSRNGLFLKKVSVETDNHCVEKMIGEVFGFWKTGQPLIKPLKWKCLQCPKVFQTQCRVFNKKDGEAHE